MGSLKYLHKGKVCKVDFVPQSESPLKILDGGIVKGIPLGDAGPIKLMVGGKIKAIGKVSEEYEIPYAYQTNGGTEIFLYQIKNLVNPPKSTNANTSYWWEYCCTKDFVFSTNMSDTSPYPWYIVKADKNGNVLDSYGPINCGYLGSICTDDQYLYASYVVVDGYDFTSYLIKLDWDLNLITSLEIGEYMAYPMSVDKDYIFSGQYITGTGDVLQKRSKTTLAVVSQVVAEYLTAMCLDEDYIWCNSYDSACIVKYSKSDLSYVGSMGSGFIEPYELWMNKEFIVSYDVGDWEGSPYLRRYRLSDGQLMQTLEPEVRSDSVSNSQWNGPDFFVNYG
jgi:hypothetical protein